MARAQNAPNGLFAKDRVDVGSNNLTGNSTALVLSAGVKISNAQTLTANTTGLVAPDAALSALPGNVRQGNVHIHLGTNTTGRFLGLNTTGTSNYYLQVTSVQPTTL